MPVTSNGEKRKWLVILRADQYDWIKEMAEETDLKGSDIVREIIDERMKENSSMFKKRLAQAQLKIKLQNINDKKLALDREAQELSKSLKEDTRVLA